MIYIVNTTNLSPIITGLSGTYDIAIGDYLYGNGIPVETVVQSIQSQSQITMSKPSTYTGAITIDVTPDEVGVYLEKMCAMEDSLMIKIERGANVIFEIRTENEIQRDRYNSIMQREQGGAFKHIIQCYPIDFSPAKNNLEGTGLKEQADVVVYSAKKSWNVLGIDFKEIDINRMTVKLRNEVYRISNKQLSSPFGDDFLDIAFGLKKK